MNRLYALLALLLALAAPASAQGLDDQYIRIYNLIQEADALHSNGQSAPALTKYLEAQSALDRFRQLNPDWNAKVVNFRLNYLSSKITALGAKVPGSPSPVIPPPDKPSAAPAPASPAPVSPPPVPAKVPVNDAEAELNLLRQQTRQLQADNALLEAKLKEALGARPASDSEALAAANNRIKTLQKENDLLKVSLAQEKTRTPSMPDPKPLQDAQQALAEVTQKLAEQTERAKALSIEKQALQSRLQNSGNDRETLAALRAENQLLKKQLTDLKASPGPAQTDSPARTLAEAQAQIAALQSDKELLRLEKIALESRVKHLSTSSSTAVSSQPAGTGEALRIKQLELERDELQKKLDAAIRQASGRRGKSASAKIDQMENELANLRARLQTFEARAVPYTPEELALFKTPETKLTVATPKSSKKSARELPPGTAKLAAEAQRHFSARQLDKAEEKYQEILQKDRGNVNVLANLATIQLEQNHFDEAEKNLKQALTVAPDDAYSLAIMGYLKFRQEKYDEALDTLSRAAQLDPDNAEIQNFLGLTLSHKGMRVPAETALRKAIQLAPGYGGAHVNLAVVYATQKPPMLELARWHYQKALTAGHPKNPELEKMLTARKTDTTGQ